jgi:hypothetical protein
VGVGLDRYDLYELCVQDAGRMAGFLRAVHGGDPRVMREDFCGGGGVARAWVELGAEYRAIAVDRDAEPLKRLRRIPRLKAVRADVISCGQKADVISATNFPIGYWHTRDGLVRYLARTRTRLHRGGVFVCDTYGGASAYVRGITRRVLRVGPRLVVRYAWEQRRADPITARVTDVVHFTVVEHGRVVAEHRDAFVYDWRLWSIPELRDAMAEAGFRRITIFDSLTDAVDERGRVYVEPVEDLGRDWVAYLVAHR